MDIQQVTVAGLSTIADVLGRALSSEPMLTWPLGTAGVDLIPRCVRQLEALDAPLVDLGMLWEAGESLGAAVWVPPGRHEEFWTAIQATVEEQKAVTEDEGQRLDRLWDWVTSVIPQEPMWLLDQIGVDPDHQGRGVGAALINFGLDQARLDGVDAYLQTGTARNVTYYQRFGFQVVAHGTVPGGGIPVWFMRWRP